MTFAFVATVVSATQAQTARKFAGKNPVVRLCPVTCTAVNGHGFKAGASTTVYETKSGWARVSGYLDRTKLVASFGVNTPRKPALWVPVSSLAFTAKAKAPVKKKTVAKKKVIAKKPKRVSVIDQLARLRNPALPSFRPNTVVASTPVVETPTTAIADVVEETVVVATPVVESPVVETVEVPSPPVVVDTQGGDQKALTWEQVQAKIAAQKRAEQTGAAEPAAAVVKKETDNAAKLAADRKAALKTAALEREAKRAEAKKLADEARQKRIAERKKTADVVKAKRVADAKVVQEERVRKRAEVKAAELAKAKEVEGAKKAQAAKLAEIAKTEEASKEDEKVGNTPPKEDAVDGVVALGATGQVVKLPPLVSSETKQEPAKVEKAESVEPATPAVKEQLVKVASVDDPAKPAGPEPTFTSAEADPIDFGKRPKKLTKALLDKRLRKLPGRKSKVKPEIVIAMRHSALGLLKSGECKGIAGGGKSAVPGMFFITCTEDPGYLRQFPIVEESW